MYAIVIRTLPQTNPHLYSYPSLLFTEVFFERSGYWQVLSISRKNYLRKETDGNPSQKGGVVMKNIIKIILIITFTVILCSNSSFAQTEEPQYGGSLVVAHPLTPPHLDTDKTTDSNVGVIMFHVFEGLFEVDQSYRPIPHLAESYSQNEDGSFYEFTLRKGVSFHDGTEMTAEDAYASFRRYLQNNGAGRNIAPYVKEIQITGTHSFSVAFHEPYAPFLYFLASPVANQKFVIKPKSLIEKYGDGTMTEFIGTGPFSFVSWVSDQYIKLKRFDGYQAVTGDSFGYSGRKEVYVDELIFRIVTEQSVRVAGVTTGEYSFADAAPRDQLPIFQRNNRIQTYIVSPYRQAFIIVNMGNPPFDNNYARQALLHALDLEELGLIVVGDPEFWFLNPSLFPPGHIWHVPHAGAGAYNHFDIAAANALLSQSDYTGEPIIILNSREDDIESKSAIVLKNQLERVGFNVDVRLYDRATVVEQRARPDGYHLHLSQFFSPDPDPQVYGAWMGTNKWIGQWDDEHSRYMDGVFEKMLRETDYETRYAIVESWHDAFYEYVPYVKLYDYKQLRIAHERLKGYSNFAFPTFFNVWLEK